MIRGYAIGLGAATQIFTLGFGEPVFGTGMLATALLTGAGWVINLAVAEWIICRRPRDGYAGPRASSPLTHERPGSARGPWGARFLDHLAQALTLP
jgi:hypothetical protein